MLEHIEAGWQLGEFGSPSTDGHAHAPNAWLAAHGGGIKDDSVVPCHVLLPVVLRERQNNPWPESMRTRLPRMRNDGRFDAV